MEGPRRPGGKEDRVPDDRPGEQERGPRLREAEPDPQDPGSRPGRWPHDLRVDGHQRVSRGGPPAAADAAEGPLRARPRAHDRGHLRPVRLSGHPRFHQRAVRLSAAHPLPQEGRQGRPQTAGGVAHQGARAPATSGSGPEGEDLVRWGRLLARRRGARPGPHRQSEDIGCPSRREIPEHQRLDRTRHEAPDLQGLGPEGTAHHQGGVSPGVLETDPRPEPRPRRPAWAAAALGALTLGVYAGALGAGFFSDDYEWLGRMTPALERPRDLFRVFYPDFNPGLHASFLVHYLLGGGAAAFFHATSLLVHAANTTLLVLLCTRLAGNPWASLATGLLWGTGARISGAVIWPAARGHSLAALFVLAALLVLTGSSRRRVFWAGALFAGALLTKEVAFFPMLLAPAFARDRAARRNTALAVGALAAAFVVFNVACKSGYDTTGEGMGAMLLKLPFVVLRPIGLGERYDFSIVDFALFAATGAGLLLLCRRSSPALLGLLWIAFCAAAVLPLHKVSSRYLYLLSIGYPLLACGLVAHPRFRHLSLAVLRTILGFGGRAG